MFISNSELGHFLHLPSGKAYNGVTPTIAEMEDPNSATQKLPTLDSMFLGQSNDVLCADFKFLQIGIVADASPVEVY